MVKFKLVCAFAGVGVAGLNAFVAWAEDHNPLFWVWLIVAGLCGATALMIEGASHRSKIKLFVPSCLTGMAGLLIGLQIFSPSYRIEPESLVMFGSVLAAAMAVIAAVKINPA